jgi:hypothetical protein
VYVSRRTSVSQSFGSPTKVPALIDNEVHPMLANARALYFASAVRTGGEGMHDVWRAEIDSTGATSTPTLVGGVNTGDAEMAPAVTADELRIFIRRIVAGESDVYTATRSTTQDRFAAAVTVPGLAEVGIDEAPSWVSPDECALYFHSNAPAGAGGVDLYVALRGSP